MSNALSTSRIRKIWHVAREQAERCHNDPEKAEDAAQDVVLSLLKAQERDEVQNPTGYAYVGGRRRAISQVCRDRRRREVSEEYPPRADERQPTPSKHVLAQEARELLERDIRAELSEFEAFVFISIKSEGLTPAEVAGSREGTSVASVVNAYYRAKNKLGLLKPSGRRKERRS